MNNLLYFSIFPKNIHVALDSYRSSESEESVWKGLPIERYDQIRKTLSSLNLKFKYRFRGPRYDLSGGCCRKDHAKSFAVYLRS